MLLDCGCWQQASDGFKNRGSSMADTTPAPDTTRKALAEAVGTFILVFFAVGAAVFGIETIGKLGVAIAFGFVLLALAYSIGPVSGCHVNPAVTLGVLLRKGITVREAVAYWIAQVVGAIVAAALLKLMVSGVGGAKDETAVSAPTTTARP